MLVLAGEDGPVCLLPVVEELASPLPAETTRLGEHSLGPSATHLPCQQPNWELRLEA
jgi:hypothetical protein